MTYDEETGTARITTDAAHRISLLTDCYYADSREAPWGESITEAEFHVFAQAKYFRFEIVDDRGYKTFTNAYFVKEQNA